MRTLAGEAADVERGLANLGVCRICLSDDDPDSMIAPCLCAGTSKWVHRDCLDEWRAQEQVPHAFSQCPTCKFEYEIVDRHEGRASRLMRFRCLMLRDTCALFLAIQLILALLALLLHWLDDGERIAMLYPHHWAERQSRLHLAIGPYYCSAVVLSLALLGVLGIYLKLTNQLPSPPPRPAARHRVDVACCPCCGERCCSGCTCDPAVVYFCDCDPCCRLCCSSAQACGECGGECGACDLGALGGEGATVLIPVLLVLLLVLAVIGLFYGAFLSMIVVQRTMQRHIHLLQMRSAAQRFVVVDRASRHGAVGASSDGEQMMPLTCCKSHRGGGAPGATCVGERLGDPGSRGPGPLRIV